MTEGTASVRGTRIAYTDHGEGPVVFNLHGLMQHRQPDRLATIIDPTAVVAAGFRVVSYDARGHGESAGSLERAQYEWTSLALDLLALADFLAPDAEICAMGISMGTGTILNALHAAPERFRAVVLGAPPTAWATRATQSGAYSKMADLIEAQGYAALLPLLSSAPEPDIFAGRTAEMGTPTPQESIAPAVLRGAAGSDLPDPDALALITVPALVLAWDTDPSHPVSTATAISAALPNAQVRLTTTADEIAGWGRQAADFLART